MKIFRNNKIFRYFIFSLIFSFFVFWIVRLELNASTMQTRWEELKKSLEQNRDNLTGLNSFVRGIGSSTLIIDQNNVGFTAGDNLVNVSNHEGLLANSKTKTSIVWDEDEIKLTVNNNFSMGMDKKLGSVYMTHNGSNIVVGDFISKGNIKHHGIEMYNQHTSNKTSEFHLTNDGIRLTSINVPLSISYLGKNNEYYGLELRPSKDLIRLMKGKSIIKFEKDKIEFKADGDINITSKNGNVIINGKKVKVNEK